MSFHHHFRLFLLLVACTAALLLAGCSKTEPTIVGDGDKQNVDADEDGLSDALEAKIGTNPNDPDTDGDGFLDGREYSLQKRDNPYFNNPLIADTAKILITVESNPQISVDYVTSSGSTDSTSIARGTAVSHGTNSSVTLGASLSVEASVQESVQVGFTDSHASTTVGTSVRAEASVSVSRGQSQEIQKNVQDVRERSQSNEISKTNGRLKVSVNVKNAGDIAATLEGFTLAAYLTYPGRSGEEKALGGLNFDNTWGEFPSSTLKPNETKGGLPFEKKDINLETLDEIVDCLARGGRIRIGVATYQLIDPNDEAHRPMDRVYTDINAKTAEVSIDYGPDIRTTENNEENYQVIDRPAEYYQVALYQADSPTMTASEALERLQIPFEVGAADWSDGAFGRTKLGLVRIRECKTNAEAGGYWVVGFTHKGSNGKFETHFYNPLKESLDLDALKLTPGSQLQLVYISDADHDRLGDRSELEWGTNPVSPDSDDDGINDGDEVEGWDIDVDDARVHVRTNPLEPDTDGDGARDLEERNAGTDPSTARIASTITDWRLAFRRVVPSKDKQTIAAGQVAVDATGSVYLTAATFNDGPPYLVAKYTPDGDPVWSKRHKIQTAEVGTANSGGLALDSDGNLFTVDSEYVKNSRGTVTRRNFLTVNKFAPSGELIWNKLLETPASDLSQDITTDSTGAVYVVGYTQGNLGDRGEGDWERSSQEAFIAKLTSSGDIAWIKQWRPMMFNAVAAISNRNIVTTANSIQDSIDGQPLKNDGVDRSMLLTNYDLSGERVWVRQFGIDGGGFISAIASDSSGGFVVGGSVNRPFDPTKGPAGGTDCFLMKFNSQGEQIWVQKIGGEAEESLTSVFVQNGLIFVIGTTRGQLARDIKDDLFDEVAEAAFESELSVFITAYDMQGRQQVIKQFPLAMYPSGSAVDRQGNAYILGRLGADMVLIKLEPIRTQVNR